MARCTKSLTAKNAITNEALKISYATHQVYALSPDGLVRVRHRSQLPLDPSGRGLPVVALPKSLVVSKETAAHVADLLDRASFRRAKELLGEGALVVLTDQAPHTATTPEGFLTTTSRRARLGEGGAGSARDSRSQLAALLLNDRVSDSFYETFAERQERRAALLKDLIATDPDWLVSFTDKLRNVHKNRTASITLAVDLAALSYPASRAILAAALSRPDEPGLALGHFFDAYPGRTIPSALRTALADAATRLYDEKTVLDFDVARTRDLAGAKLSRQPVRFADVISLAHPRPKDAAQSALFAHLVRGTDPDASLLPTLATVARLHKLSPGARRALIDQAALSARQVLASGYREGAQVNSDLAALSLRDLLAWRPATPEASAAHQVLKLREEELAARYAALSGRDPETTSLPSAKTIASRLRALRAHTHQPYDDLARPNRAARQEKIDALEEILRGRQELDRDALRVKTELNAPSADLLAVALPTMSYKTTLTTAATLFAANDRLIDAFTLARLADPAAARQSNVSLSDYMTAARAIAPKEDGYPDDDDDYESPSIVPSRFDDATVNKVVNALDQASTKLAADTLGDLGDKKILVLVDASGSMHSPVSLRRGDERAGAYAGLQRDELAATFAGFIASQGSNVSVVSYDTVGRRVDLEDSTGPISAGLATIAAATGGGTDTWGVLSDWYNDHEIVVILTDEQTSWSPFEPRNSNDYFRALRRGRENWHLPASTKVVTCNLAGDVGAQAPSHPGHLSIAGASPAVLEAIAAAARGESWAAGV